MTVASLMLAGCAGQGSGSSTTGTSSVGQTTSIGALLVTTAGQAKPLITTSTPSVSTFAEAGAAYSSIVCNPAKNLGDTFLALSRIVNGVTEVARVPYNGGSETPLVGSSSGANWKVTGCSQNGLLCLIDSGNDTVWGVNPDGSGLKNIQGSTSAIFADISPNGSTVAISNGNLNTQPYGGGALTPLGVGGSWQDVAFSPTGTTIAGVGVYGEGGQPGVLVTSTAKNSSALDITPSGYSSGEWENSIAWSPDGTSLIGTYQPGNTQEIVEFNIVTGFSQVLTHSGLNETYPVFSPDGSMIAFYRTAVGGATPGIYIANSYGLQSQLVDADPTGTNVQSLCWTDFLPTKTFVGAGGVLGSSAAGFIYSQVGSRFASLASFNATTPSTATVTAPSPGSTYGPLLYTLSANEITTIAYTNVYIGLTTSFGIDEPTAVISVDGQTGLIDTVISAATPAKKTQAGSITALDGQFTAIYDSNGKNRAPHGARHVEIGKTGTLLSFR